MLVDEAPDLGVVRAQPPGQPPGAGVELAQRLQLAQRASALHDPEQDQAHHGRRVVGRAPAPLVFLDELGPVLLLQELAHPEDLAMLPLDQEVLQVLAADQDALRAARAELHAAAFAAALAVGPLLALHRLLVSKQVHLAVGVDANGTVFLFSLFLFARHSRAVYHKSMTFPSNKIFRLFPTESRKCYFATPSFEGVAKGLRGPKGRKGRKGQEALKERFE